jgi:hypothetical protein
VKVDLEDAKYCMFLLEDHYVSEPKLSKYGRAGVNEN